MGWDAKVARTCWAEQRRGGTHTERSVDAQRVPLSLGGALICEGVRRNYPCQETNNRKAAEQMSHRSHVGLGIAFVPTSKSENNS